MIDDAERYGRLTPGGTIVEATAGNTGLGLAQVGIPKGYNIVLVVPDKMSREKIQHLRALGAEVRMTRSDVGKGHPEYYQDMAEKHRRGNPRRLLRQPVRQPRQPGGARDHHRPGNLEAARRGCRRGRGRRRLGRHADRHRPLLREGVAEDRDGAGRSGRLGAGAIDQDRQDGRGRQLDGRGHRRGFRAAQRRPVAGQEGLFDLRQAHRCWRSATCCRSEGILAGSSSGTLLAAALRYCREQTEAKRVVTFVCDSGNKYLSKVFDDFWLAEQGLSEQAQHGDLRDLVARSPREGGMLSVGPGGQPAHRLRPHAARRRLATARHRRRQARRHRRRRRHPRGCRRAV